MAVKPEKVPPFPFHCELWVVILSFGWWFQLGLLLCSNLFLLYEIIWEMCYTFIYTGEINVLSLGDHNKIDFKEL